MKRLREILKAIHSLPEEARKLLAGFAFVISILLLFGLWNISIPYRLSSLSETSTLPTSAVSESVLPSEEENQVLTPAGGLAESFRSLGSFFPNFSVKPGVKKERLQNLKKNLERHAESALTKMANFLFYTNLN